MEKRNKGTSNLVVTMAQIMQRVNEFINNNSEGLDENKIILVVFSYIMSMKNSLQI